jgi:hypothetical protein
VSIEEQTDFRLLAVTEEITCINLIRHISEFIGHAIADNKIRLVLEGAQIGKNARVEKNAFLHYWLVDDDFDALGLNAFHNALNTGGSEVVRIAFHDKAVDTYSSGLTLQDVTGDEVLAGVIRFDDSVYKVLRHIVVVREQLFGVFG